MLFNISQAVKSLRYKPAITILTLVSLCGAYLVLFIGSCYVEALLNSLYSFQVQEPDTSVVATYYIQGDEHVEVPQQVKEHIMASQGVDAVCIVTSITQRRVNDTDLHFSIMDEGFVDTFRFRLLEGRLFSQEEYNNATYLCVIEKDLRDIQNIQIGDSVEIGQDQFLVVGVIESMEFTGRSFITRAWIDQYANSISKYEIVVKLTDMKYANDLPWDQLGGKNKVVETAQEHYHASIQQAKGLVLLVDGVAFAVFLYAMLSTYNILYARILSRRKNIGIRLMLGASKKQIEMHIYLEILFLSICAILLVFCAEPMIYHFVHETINHTFGLFTVIFMLLSALLISCPMAHIIVSKLLKHQSIAASVGGIAA